MQHITPDSVWDTHSPAWPLPAPQLAASAATPSHTPPADTGLLSDRSPHADKLLPTASHMASFYGGSYASLLLLLRLLLCVFLPMLLVAAYTA